MERRTFRDGDDPAAFPGAVLCRDLSLRGTHPQPTVTIRRGTSLVDALRRLANVNERPPLEVVVPCPNEIGQEDASLLLARRISGSGVALDGPHQGQVNLRAAGAGLLRVNGSGVAQLNRSDAALVASALDGRVVEAGETVAVVKAPALFVARDDLETSLGGLEVATLLAVRPFTARRVGFIAGTRIRPANLRVAARSIGAGLRRFGAKLIEPSHLDDDDPGRIASEYRRLLDAGASAILVAGTIMLDPADPFIVAAEQMRAEVVARGAPIDPGTMFWLAYVGTRDVPIFGLASCELYGRTSILDLLLPYALAGERISRDLIAALGYGGLLAETQAARRPSSWIEASATTDAPARTAP